MVSLKVGNRRLLKLANILDAAHQQQIASGGPTYDQTDMVHPCGSPCCALGHWAHANPKLWKFDARNGCFKHLPEGMYGLEPAAKDFHLEQHEVYELFGGSGCGSARTATDAATYIRRFVNQRSGHSAGAPQE